MNSSIDMLAPAAFGAVVVALGMKARQRRQDAKLGDMFLDAVKDKTYRALIAGMVCSLALSAILLMTASR